MSDVRRQMSDVRRPTSDVRCPMSDVRRQIADVRRPTSRCSTSDFRYPQSRSSAIGDTRQQRSLALFARPDIESGASGFGFKPVRFATGCGLQAEARSGAIDVSVELSKIRVYGVALEVVRHAQA